MVEINELINIQKEWTWKQPEDKKEPPTIIISQVNNNNEATLQFSKSMRLPENLSQLVATQKIDNRLLDLSVIEEERDGKDQRV